MRQQLININSGKNIANIRTSNPFTEFRMNTTQSKQKKIVISVWCTLNSNSMRFAINGLNCLLNDCIHYCESIIMIIFAICLSLWLSWAPIILSARHKWENALPLHTVGWREQQQRHKKAYGIGHFIVWSIPHVFAGAISICKKRNTAENNCLFFLFSCLSQVICVCWRKYILHIIGYTFSSRQWLLLLTRLTGNCSITWFLV